MVGSETKRWSKRAKHIKIERCMVMKDIVVLGVHRNVMHDERFLLSTSLSTFFIYAKAYLDPPILNKVIIIRYNHNHSTFYDA